MKVIWKIFNLKVWEILNFELFLWLNSIKLQNMILEWKFNWVMSSQWGQQHKLHYVKEGHVKSNWSDLTTPTNAPPPQNFHFEAI
jgi:hypothetical protein